MVNPTLEAVETELKLCTVKLLSKMSLYVLVGGFDPA